MPNQTTAARERFEALSDEARARWLDPAEAEFCARGFDAASLNRIVAQAGESKGRTYHYFADKAELFRATLERRLARHALLGQLGGALSAPDAAGYWAELAALSGRLTQILQADEALAALLRTLHLEIPAQQAFAAPFTALRDAIGELLEAGQALGAVRDDLPQSLLIDVVLSLVATIDRWFALNAAALPDEAEAELSQRAFSLLAAPLIPPNNSEGRLP
ncbi:TetR/AcrR family transcriptional regulator [Pseudoroseicyclus sp. H15]